MLSPLVRLCFISSSHLCALRNSFSTLIHSLSSSETCLLLCCSTSLCFPTFSCFFDSFLRCLHSLHCSLLGMFTLITIPLLLSISQSICQTLPNQHKSILAPLFFSSLWLVQLFQFRPFSSSVGCPSRPPDCAFQPPTSVTDTITCELQFGACFFLLLLF